MFGRSLVVMGPSELLTASRPRSLQPSRTGRGRKFQTTSSVQPLDKFSEATLRNWITRRGGYVHPALKLVDCAPCGARGVIAVDDISMQEVEERPLILVPAAAELTFENALETLEPLVPNSVLRQAPLHTLDAGALVALLIAHERNKGTDSEWWPFIASLPSQLCCPWALPDEEVHTTIQRLADDGVDTQGWAEQVKEAQRYLEMVSGGMGKDYSEYINVSPEDIKWAIGIVSSRGFGGELRPGLVPYVDLVNHNCKSASFIWTNENLDTQAMYAVWSTWDGAPRTLSAGEELYVDYKMGNLTTLDTFLSHGFVPAELM